MKMEQLLIAIFIGYVAWKIVQAVDYNERVINKEKTK
jgi:hypothetical protein